MGSEQIIYSKLYTSFKMIDLIYITDGAVWTNHTNILRVEMVCSRFSLWQHHLTNTWIYKTVWKNQTNREMYLLLSFLRPSVIQQEFPSILSLSLLQTASYSQVVGFCSDSEHRLGL